MIGGEKALDNCIFYNHSQTLAFNFRSYDNISTELIDKIKQNIEQFINGIVDTTLQNPHEAVGDYIIDKFLKLQENQVTN